MSDGEGLLVQAHRPIVVSPMVSYSPQLTQRTMRAFSVAQIVIQGQARLVQTRPRGRSLRVLLSG